MKNKVKQMVCMVCAFVLSFMLTVTAFASGFTISGSKIPGMYYAVNNPNSFVNIDKNRMLLKAYYVNIYDEYVYARSSDGSIDYARYGMFYEMGRGCDKNGDLNGVTVSDFTVQGDVEVDGLFDLFFIKSITLIPRNQTERYVQEM